MLSIIVPIGPSCQIPWPLIKQLTAEDGSITVSCPHAKPTLATDQIDWVQSPPGRAKQLNEAIHQTNADWLWIIHADSSLPVGAVGIVSEFCRSSTWQDIGYCHLKFGSDGPPWVKLNEWGANLRTQFLRQPYGDQGLCIHRKMWSLLDGFQSHLDRGEDLDFIIRSRQLDAKLKPLPLTIMTSARRYRAKGWLRTTLDHQKKAWALVTQAKKWRP